MAPEVADELDLRAYLVILRRRWRWIVGTTILLVGASLALSLQQESLYQATAELLIRSQAPDAVLSTPNPSPVDAERALNNEIEILESGSVHDAVRENYAGPLDVEKVSAAVASDRSDVVRVSVTAPDPDEAAALANTYIATYVDFRRLQRIEELLAAGAEIQVQIDRLGTEIAELRRPLDEAEAALSDDPENEALLAERDRVAVRVQSELVPLESQQDFNRQQLDDLELTAGLIRAGGAQVLTEATPPASPVSPEPVRNAVVGLVLGLMLGIALAFAREYFDESIRTVEDLDRLGGGQIATLGVIPAGPDEIAPLVASSNGNVGSPASAPGSASAPPLASPSASPSASPPASASAEAYRALRTAVRFAGLERRMKVLQVTSPTEGEGKTTTVANLAYSLSQAGQRVVVVCCDLRRPRVHEFFAEDQSPGLSDVLLQEATLSQALRRTSADLYLLPAGIRPPNPSELLGTDRAQQVIAARAEEFDLVLVDSTPILPVTDGIVVSRMVDATLLVASARATRRHQVTQALTLIRQVDAPILGFVLNRVPTSGRGSYAYSYSYGYSPSQPEGHRGAGWNRRSRARQDGETVSTRA